MGPKQRRDRSELQPPQEQLRVTLHPIGRTVTAPGAVVRHEASQIVGPSHGDVCGRRRLIDLELEDRPVGERVAGADLRVPEVGPPDWSQHRVPSPNQPPISMGTK